MDELKTLTDDQEITEILINDMTEVWIERGGMLSRSNFVWSSSLEYSQFVRKLLDALNSDLSLQDPFCSGRIGHFRVQVVGPPVTKHPIISFRRIRPQTLPLHQWLLGGSMTEDMHLQLLKLISQKENILIFGSTGCGKTTLLSSLLGEVKTHERVVMLEDIEELGIPNPLSLRLLTRNDPTGVMKDISLTDLLRHSLRLRPDRLALGEVRGAEAKDLLLALATGHKGSFGTIHAHSVHEALLRLEMLVQLGASKWQSHSIRKLIKLSIDAVVGLERGADGKRRVNQIHRITGLEEFGFLTERVA